MKRKNTTRNALFSSIISLLLCVSMLVGTTFAWFTDSVESGMNAITAGKLDVELYHSDDAVSGEKVTNITKLFDDVALWEPGAVVYENLVVKNEGNLALKYQLALTFANATKNSKGRTLADVLKVAVVKGGFNGDREAAKALSFDQTLSTFTLSGELSKGQSSDTYGIVIYWAPGDNDNDFNMNNGQSTVMKIDLGVSLFATQLESENDSFDNTYDKDASLIIPEIKVETPTLDALLAALEKGETAVLTSDTVLGDEDFVIPEGVTSAIDLNGHSLTVGANGGVAVEGGLILTGTGDINVTSGEGGTYAGFLVDEGATMVLGEGVSINTPDDTIGAIVYGTLVVDGAQINAEAGSHGIFTMEGGDVDIIINSGSVTGEGDAIYVGWGSKANIVVGEDAQVGTIQVLSSATAHVTYYGETAPTVVSDNTATTITVRKGTAYDGITQDKDNDMTYYVESKEGLLNLNEMLNNHPAGSEQYLTVNLTTDVDLDGAEWTGLGKMFVHFDGNEHKISNFTVNGNEDWAGKSGFFAYLGGGSISNLTLENVTSSGSEAGIFAGQSEGGDIINCKIAGTNTVNWTGDSADKICRNGIGAFVGISVETNNTSGEILEGATVTLNKGAMDATNNVWENNNIYVGGLYTTTQNVSVTNNGAVNTVIPVANSAELAAAVKGAATAGTTVIVLADGTYSDDLDITLAAVGTQKGDIVFKAAEGAKPVIAGTVTLGLFENKTTNVAKWDANVTFEGITFDHAEAEKDSLSVQNVGVLTLTDCTIIGNGEYGIRGVSGGAAYNSRIIDCTFVNAAFQPHGNFGTGLLIDGCTFEESVINIQGGNGVTVQNCNFSNTLTDANNNESFYVIRSNSTPVTVTGCNIAIDSTVTGTGVPGSKGWGVFVNRGTTDWTVSNVNVSLTLTATAQTALEITKTTSTGAINCTNLNVKRTETVSSDADLATALKEGNDVILADGVEYTMPSSGTTSAVTITGTKDAVLDVTLGAYMDSAASVTIKGVTIKTSTGKAGGNGSDDAALYAKNVTYIDCTFVGPMNLGRDGAKFIECTFTELGNDYVWSMENDATFEWCTFYTEGKALLLYAHGTHASDGTAEISVKNCTFISTKSATAYQIANQPCAAIEIHNYGCSIKLTTEGNTYDSNFSGEWRIKAFENNGRTVTVNGVAYTTIALDGKTMTIDADRNVTVNG